MDKENETKLPEFSELFHIRTVLYEKACRLVKVFGDNGMFAELYDDILALNTELKNQEKIWTDYHDKICYVKGKQ